MITAVAGVKRKIAELSSLSDGMNVSSQLARMPRRSMGSVIRRKVRSCDEPRVRAQCSSSTSMLLRPASLPA